MKQQQTESSLLSYVVLVVIVFGPAWALWSFRGTSHTVIWWACALAFIALLVHLLENRKKLNSRPLNASSESEDTPVDVRPWQLRVEEIELNRVPEIQIVLPVGREQHEQLKQFMTKGQWDEARQILQKMSYDMPQASYEEKRLFALYAVEFAKLDPLFSSVLDVVMPALNAQPGIKQTEIYDLLPDVDKETVRYVLYYANMLNIIERSKSGSTYQLFPYMEGISEPWSAPAKRKPKTLSDKAMIKDIAIAAHLQAKPIVAQSAPIMAAIKSDSRRNLHQVLSECCPVDPWPWPEAEALIDANAHIRTRRNQRIEFLTHMIWRAHHWRSRVPQLLEIVDRRPYWQLWSAIDSKDRVECAKLDGRIERYDDAFWTTHAPWLCNHPFCRCTVTPRRSKNPDDFFGNHDT